MANITVNTQAAAYINRHDQFRTIVAFWKPLLIEYFKMDGEQRRAWRQNDPFLADLVRFAKAVYSLEEGRLD